MVWKAKDLPYHFQVFKYFQTWSKIGKLGGNREFLSKMYNFSYFFSLFLRLILALSHTIIFCPSAGPENSFNIWVCFILYISFIYFFRDKNYTIYLENNKWIKCKFIMAAALEQYMKMGVKKMMRKIFSWFS